MIELRFGNGYIEPEFMEMVYMINGITDARDKLEGNDDCKKIVEQLGNAREFLDYIFISRNIKVRVKKPKWEE